MAVSLHKSSSSYALIAVKILLGKRASLFSIRLAIAIVESGIDAQQLFCLGGSSDKSFTSDYSMDDVLDFLTVAHCSKLSIQPIPYSESDSHTFHKLTLMGLVFEFGLPKKVNRRLVLSKENRKEALVSAVFEIWFDLIGSDKVLYSRSPSLTTSKSGRKPIIMKAIELGFISDLDEVRNACIGCRTSLFHMGFSETGESTGRRYCDIKHIFINRQRVEEMCSRQGLDYTHQLEKIQKKNNKVAALLSKETSTSSTETSCEMSALEDNSGAWW